MAHWLRLAPRALMSASLLALAACGSHKAPEDNATAGIATPATDASQSNATVDQPTPPANQPANESAATDPAPTASPAPDPSGPRSCETEIGKAAAQKKVRACLDASPATHPPCNVANSCAMMDDEIARACALFDGKGQPMPGCKPDPTSKEAAAAVVQRYYAAIDARDYGTAWQQWGDDGPPNQSQQKFAAGFAHTRSTKVTIGALQPGEGAAGSIYQTVPVTVDATLDDGSHQRFTGDYIVRRVNGVDGASADQLRWHIDSAHLKPAKG